MTLRDLGGSGELCRRENWRAFRSRRQGGASFFWQRPGQIAAIEVETGEGAEDEDVRRVMKPVKGWMPVLIQRDDVSVGQRRVWRVRVQQPTRRMDTVPLRL